MVKYIRNLEEQTKSVLHESLADDLAKLLNIKPEEANNIVSSLQFSDYLELANAVDIEDREMAMSLLDYAEPVEEEAIEEIAPVVGMAARAAGAAVGSKVANKVMGEDDCDDMKLLDKPTMSLKDIAKKHGVSLAELGSQLAMGIKVELEHSNDRKIAKEIALDHLMELPDYYTRLDKMEHEGKEVEEEGGAGGTGAGAVGVGGEAAGVGTGKQPTKTGYEGAGKGIYEAKAGSFKSPIIGQRVKIVSQEDAFGNNHFGEEGVVTRASREHTFSSMRPWVIEYGVELDSGEKITIRRESVRKIKAAPEAPVEEADNPYEITPPSEAGPMAGDEAPLGRKSIDDLMTGDDIEVIDIDGEPTAVTVKNAKAPGDTIIVQTDTGEEHIVKKQAVSGTPQMEELQGMYEAAMGEAKFDVTLSGDGETDVVVSGVSMKEALRAVNKQLQVFQDIAIQGTGGYPGDEGSMHIHKTTYRPKVNGEPMRLPEWMIKDEITGTISYLVVKPAGALEEKGRWTRIKNSDKKLGQKIKRADRVEKKKKLDHVDEANLERPQQLAKEHQQAIKDAVVPALSKIIGQNPGAVKWHRNPYDEWTLYVDFPKKVDLEYSAGQKLARRLNAKAYKPLYDAAELSLGSVYSTTDGRVGVWFERVWPSELEEADEPKMKMFNPVSADDKNTRVYLPRTIRAILRSNGIEPKGRVVVNPHPHGDGVVVRFNKLEGVERNGVSYSLDAAKAIYDELRFVGWNVENYPTFVGGGVNVFVSNERPEGTLMMKEGKAADKIKPINKMGYAPKAGSWKRRMHKAQPPENHEKTKKRHKKLREEDIDMLDEAQTIEWLGIPEVKKAPPTRKHRPAIWEGILGAVYAMNDQFQTKYFDFDYDGAREFAGIPNKRDIRIYRYKEQFRRQWNSDRHPDVPGRNQYVLWVEKESAPQVSEPIEEEFRNTIFDKEGDHVGTPLGNGVILAIQPMDDHGNQLVRVKMDKYKDHDGDSFTFNAGDLTPPKGDENLSRMRQLAGIKEAPQSNRVTVQGGPYDGAVGVVVDQKGMRDDFGQRIKRVTIKLDNGKYIELHTGGDAEAKLIKETASGGATGAGAIASAPAAVGDMHSRNPGIYGKTTEKPKKKKRTKENKSDGIGRSRKE